jgi:sugar lactone lactonase YvrE
VEQGRNRLLRYDPATQQLTTWLQLENTPGLLGVDNIALDTHDPQHLSLIVPDSPNGRVLRVRLDGAPSAQVSEIAHGFLRPTSAAIEPDGSILIVDEDNGALKRIHPDGTIEFIVSLPVPDDVVVDAQGTIYVATLGDSAIYQFAPGSSPGKIFVKGLAGPQGLALDRAGNFIVADTGIGS